MVFILLGFNQSHSFTQPKPKRGQTKIHFLVIYPQPPKFFSYGKQFYLLPRNRRISHTLSKTLFLSAKKPKREMGGGGKQGQGGIIMVVEAPKGLMVPQNPVAEIQAKYKELESGFKNWLSKQSIAVEAAVVTATSGAQGAAIGGLMGTLTNDASTSLPPTPPGLNPDAMTSLKQAQALAGGPLIQARNFAVMTGVNAGISCVMKRIRGKEDVQTSMAAAFGSGAAFSLVSGMGGGPNPVANAVTSGLFFALVQGGLFKLGEKFSKPPTEDLFYAKTRSMLANLGLQSYEKNFKRGLLTDSTLPLLNDSALRDVKIPPGPRLLILDHIQSDPEWNDKKGRK